MNEAEALEAFFSAYEADLDAGHPRKLEAYRSRWPEHGEAIARAFQEIVDESSSGLPELLESALVIKDAIATSKEVPCDDLIEFKHPERIGPYRLIRILGTGGMGEVWLAEEDRPRRFVALKLLRHDRVTPEILRRFEHEAELLGRITHPGIAQVYAAGSARTPTGLQPYIALQFIDGESLAHRLRIKTPPTASEALSSEKSAPPTRHEVLADVQLIQKVARALQSAHDCGIVHRDVKPSNILLTKDNEPVLVDFGIARALDRSGTALTREGVAPGTPLYMSPEQIRGETALDPRSDVWSLGVTLYECVTGQRPFHGATYEDVRHSILNRDPERARSLVRNIPTDLETVLEVALEKERDRRLSSAAAFADDLSAICNQQPIHSRPISRLGRVVRWARREPAKALLITVLAITLPALASLMTYLVETRDDVNAAREQARVDKVESHLEAGFFLLSESNFDGALAEFDKALGIDSNSVEAVVGKGVAVLRRPEAALDLVPSSRTDRPSRRLRAAALRRLGRLSEASEIESALGSPESALESFIAGTIADSMAEGGDVEARSRSLDYSLRAVMAAPKARLLYFSRATLTAGKSKDLRIVRCLVDAMVHQWPLSVRARIQAAQALGNAGSAPSESMVHHREAVKLLERANVDNDLRAAAHGNLAAQLLGMRDLENAEIEVRKAIHSTEHLPAIWITLAAILSEKREFKLALPAARKGYGMAKQRPEAGNMLGSVLIDLDEIDEAAGILQDVVKDHPDFAPAWSNLGRIRSSQGFIDGAIECYEKAIAIQPVFPAAYHNLATAYQRIGNLPRAIAAQRMAAEQGPEIPEVRIRICDFLIEAKRAEEAIEILDRELLQDPSSALAHYTRGWALFALRRYEEAVPSLERGHELGQHVRGWTAPSAGLLRDCRARAATSERSKRILSGEVSDAEPGELVAAAEFAEVGQRFHDSVRLYSEAFERDPALANDLKRSRRVSAAIAAARSLAEPPPKDLDPKTYHEELRRKAYLWLRAELDAWRIRAQAARAPEDELRRIIKLVSTHAAFDQFRTEAASTTDPQTQPWARLWADFELLANELH